MKNCKKIKVFFVEALYDELAAPQLTQLQEHLKECRKCASQYEEMKTTLGLMSQKTEEKPTEEFWKKFTDNVMEKIEKKNKKSSFFVMPKWSLQLAGAAALVIMGIFIGRYIKATPVVEQSIANNYVNTQAGVYPAAVTRQAAQYLEKSKILLLGVVNMDTEGVKQQSMDFSHQRKVSRDLVHQAAVLKKKLSETDQIRLKMLISELELILMQISNYEQEFDIPAIELIKSSVDNRGILLKINVEEMIISSQPELNEDNKNKNRIRL